MVSEKKQKDIHKIALDALSRTRCLGVFPTPVEKILNYADLKINSNVDLSKAPDTFFSRHNLLLKRGLAKVRGVLDRREKIIYLDLGQLEVKKRFVQLHEVGHELLGWQGKLLSYLDDDETLDLDTSERFEAEANFFASSALFQLGIFNDKMAEYPLGLNSSIQLAKLFGSSIHAAIRRYVEQSKKRCALLVLNVDSNGGYCSPTLSLRDYFQSPSFTSEWGLIKWSSTFDQDVPFVQDYLSNRKMTNGELVVDSGLEDINCNYQYFFNNYNVFVFMFPKGEYIKSRTKFVIHRDSL